VGVGVLLAVSAILALFNAFVQTKRYWPRFAILRKAGGSLCSSPSHIEELWAKSRRMRYALVCEFRPAGRKIRAAKFHLGYATNHSFKNYAHNSDFCLTFYVLSLFLFLGSLTKVDLVPRCGRMYSCVAVAADRDRFALLTSLHQREKSYNTILNNLISVCVFFLFSYQLIPTHSFLSGLVRECSCE